MRSLSRIAAARRPIVVLAVALVGLLGLAVAHAEFSQEGKLLVSFDAGMKPTNLPRDEAVPVKVGFRGSFENLDASDTPPLATMVVRLARGGVIDSTGLPRCQPRRLERLDTAGALRACGAAKIGTGTASSAFRFPDGQRARSKARMLLFNTGGGIVMHLYTTTPLEGTFVVPMTIHRGSGAFGTVLKARFPKIAAGYGYLTGFEMVIQRSFANRGKRRSYVLASCPAPKAYDKVVFELARVVYHFRNGVRVTNSALGSCTVRGG